MKKRNWKKGLVGKLCAISSVLTAAEPVSRAGLFDNVSSLIPNTSSLVSTFIIGGSAVSFIKVATRSLSKGIDMMMNNFAQTRLNSKIQRAVMNTSINFNDINVKVLRRNLRSKLFYMFFYDLENVSKCIDWFCGAIERKQKDPSCNLKIPLVVGGPGCGKTTLIKMMIKAIGTPGVVLDPSMVDPDDKSRSQVAQLTGKWEKVVSGQRITEYSPFMAALLNKPKNNTLILTLDDVDKMSSSVLNKLWSACDGGTWNIEGREIDMSELFILGTANCSPAEMASDMRGADVTKALSSRFEVFHLRSPKIIHYMVAIRSLIDSINDESDDFTFNLSYKKLYRIAKYYYEQGTGMRCLSSIKTMLMGIRQKEQEADQNMADLTFNVDDKGDMHLDSMRYVKEIFGDSYLATEIEEDMNDDELANDLVDDLSSLNSEINLYKKIKEQQANIVQNIESDEVQPENKSEEQKENVVQNVESKNKPEEKKENVVQNIESDEVQPENKLEEQPDVNKAANFIDKLEENSPEIDSRG